MAQLLWRQKFLLRRKTDRNARSQHALEDGRRLGKSARRHSSRLTQQQKSSGHAAVGAAKAGLARRNSGGCNETDIARNYHVAAIDRGGETLPQHFQRRGIIVKKVALALALTCALVPASTRAQNAY